MKFNLFARVEALEAAFQRIPLIEANQAAIAEQLRSKGTVDAELREHINVVAHDTAALMGAVDKLSAWVGSPEPAQEPTPEQAAERVENILESPFAGDNTSNTDNTFIPDPNAPALKYVE